MLAATATTASAQGSSDMTFMARLFQFGDDADVTVKRYKSMAVLLGS